MNRTLYRILSLSLLMTVLVAFGALASGQEEVVDDRECHDGELDDRYCDVTGNMVADPPANESDWEDPDTLIFAYTPVEDPAVYEEVWEEFLDYLEERLGKNVQFFGVQSYSAQVEAMRAGRLHISGFASGNVQNAVNEAGFVPQTIMAEPGDTYGYRMEIIVHQDSDIQSVDDLRGREIAFVSESSNSGYFAPRALLYEEFGMLPGEDYQTAFSGSHDNSILGVFHQDYEAAAIADVVAVRMYDGGRLPDINQLRPIYTSNEFPTTAYGVAHNLHPDLQEQIRQAFLDFDWEGTRLTQEWEDRDRFIEVDYQSDWEVLRIIRDGSDAVADILGE